MTQEEANKKLEEIQEEFFITNTSLQTKYIAVVNTNNFEPNPKGYYLEIGISNSETLTIIDAYKNDAIIKSSSFDRFINTFNDPKEIENAIKNDKKIFVFSGANKYCTTRDDFSHSENHYDKLVSGISISNAGDTSSSGTAGAFFKIKNDTFMITNRHVLLLSKDRCVSQPSLSDTGGTKPKSKIGEILWWSNDGKEKDRDTYMDAAIAKISYPVDFIKASRCKGVTYNGIKKPAKIGMRVRKCGRTTGLTYGVIRSVNCVVNIQERGDTYLYEEQILTSFMSESGDSGSILIDDTNHIVGLLFAGDTEKHNSYYNNIERVFEKFSKEINIDKTLINFKTD